MDSPNGLARRQARRLPSFIARRVARSTQTLQRYPMNTGRQPPPMRQRQPRTLSLLGATTVAGFLDEAIPDFIGIPATGHFGAGSLLMSLLAQLIGIRCRDGIE